MLRDFITSNGPELIDRCRRKVANRRAPRATPSELEFGVPFFLEHLADMLPDGSGRPGDLASLGVSQTVDGSTRHGRELHRHNFTVEQVVHDYRDLRESIAALALEQDVEITLSEYETLDTGLDSAVGGAVTEFARQHRISEGNTEEGALARNERLGILAHEMRNLLNTAILAISAIKRGSVGFGGATALALDRSLIGMRGLIDRTLAEVRLDDGADSLREVIEIGPFIWEVQVASALEAANKGCELSIIPVEEGIFVEADRHILAAAVANLLENAFEFVRDDCQVLLRAHAAQGRVLLEVEDECGGVSHGMAEHFRPFEQHNTDRRGVRAGLLISRKGIEASGGTLSARNVPGRGCIFTINLPEKMIPAGA
jgi:signal transduction histidine kinase